MNTGLCVVSRSRVSLSESRSEPRRRPAERGRTPSRADVLKATHKAPEVRADPVEWLTSSHSLSSCRLRGGVEAHCDAVVNALPPSSARCSRCCSSAGPVSAEAIVYAQAGEQPPVRCQPREPATAPTTQGRARHPAKASLLTSPDLLRGGIWARRWRAPRQGARPLRQRKPPTVPVAARRLYPAVRLGRYVRSGEDQLVGAVASSSGPGRDSARPQLGHDMPHAAAKPLTSYFSPC